MDSASDPNDVVGVGEIDDEEEDAEGMVASVNTHDENASPSRSSGDATDSYFGNDGFQSHDRRCDAKYPLLQVPIPPLTEESDLEFDWFYCMVKSFISEAIHRRIRETKVVQKYVPEHLLRKNISVTKRAVWKWIAQTLQVISSNLETCLTSSNRILE